MDSLHDGGSCYLGGSACRVVVDRENRIVTKKVDRDNEGIENGYNKLYYEVAHMKLAQERGVEFYPKVLETHYEGNEFCASMEFLYDGNTLSDLLKNRECDQDYINTSLEFILDKLFQRFYMPGNCPPGPDYVIKLYIERTVRRIDKALEIIKEHNLKWERLLKAITKGVIINQSYYPSVYRYMELLKRNSRFLSEIMIERTYESHHDLIGANILIDQAKHPYRIDGFKLIDPRGEQETGREYRHYMYDMGKMLMSLDCYDIFRALYNKPGQKQYIFQSEEGGEVDSYVLKFNLNDPVINHYKETQRMWWNIMFKIQKLRGLSEAEIQKDNIRFLYSFAHMYYPDIPCRMIDEENEELALSFYVRGMMITRYFLNKAWGGDPLKLPEDKKKETLWEPMD